MKSVALVCFRPMTLMENVQGHLNMLKCEGVIDFHLQFAFQQSQPDSALPSVCHFSLMSAPDLKRSN